MDKFDKPVWNEIFLNLELKDLLRDCKINKRTNIVCQNDDFWKEYIQRKYGLTVLRPGLDAKATAIISDKLLNDLWGKELYPTVKSFNYIIRYVEDFDDIIDLYSPQQLMSVMGSDDNLAIGIQKTSKYFQVQLPNIENGDMGNLRIEVNNWGLTHFVLNPLAKRNIKKVLDFIYVDTKYLTPKGIIILPLEYDKFSYFQYLINNQDFTQFVNSIVRLKAKELIIRYL